MANICDPTPEQLAGWSEWLAARPESVRRLAERFVPWKLYRMKTTGHRCTVHSFGEDGTLVVSVTGRYNRVLFDHSVFGVSPDDLVECDLPAPGEFLGSAAAEAGYGEADVRVVLIPKIREELRKTHDRSECNTPGCLLCETGGDAA